jgi:hypothetical protein
MFYNNSYLGMHFIWWVVWALVIMWFVFWPFARKKRSSKTNVKDRNTKLPTNSSNISLVKTDLAKSQLQKTSSRQLIYSMRNGKQVFDPMFSQITNN